jgi:16S rRNA (guanine527-N7)-methyltransferase
VFADRLALASRYADHLADTGVSHGLIGPREVPRLWERHLLNCALLSDLLPPGASVIDVGAGAGLPGIPLAVRRPDLVVTLVEPLLRRATWLQTVLADLALEHVQLRRARAEDLAGELTAAFVTARAVAPLDRLVRWGAPLLVPGGEMLAIKGRSAPAELDAHAALLRRWGITGEVVEIGTGLVDDPTIVVRLTVPDPTAVLERPGRAARGHSRARRRPGRGPGAG